MNPKLLALSAVVIIIGLIGGLNQNAVIDATTASVGVASGSRNEGVHGAGFLQAFLPGNNCYSYFGNDRGDCYSDSETNTYGSATAYAYARMSVLNPTASSAGPEYQPPNYVYNGKSVYVGDITIKYFCDGDKQYIRPYDNLGWYTCNENGCSGSEVSKSGTYVIKAPQDHLPQIRFQCFDYTKKTASNGDWAYSWVWAGIMYYSNNNIQLVTTIPDTDGDGVKDNLDKCHASQLPVDSNGCYKPAVQPPVVNNTPPVNPPVNPPQSSGFDLWQVIKDIINFILGIFGGSL